MMAPARLQLSGPALFGYKARARALLAFIGLADKADCIIPDENFPRGLLGYELMLLSIAVNIVTEAPGSPLPDQCL
jgi:hypothetical protein